MKMAKNNLATGGRRAVLTIIVLLARVVSASNAEEYGECAFGLPGSSNATTVSSSELEAAILDAAAYDKNVRPSLAVSGTLDAAADVVEVQLWVTAYNLIELTQTLLLSGFLRTYWTDPRLAYGAPGPDCAAAAAEEPWVLSEARYASIWRPDTYSENAKEIDAREDASSGTRIYANGSVYDARFVNAELSCKLHVDLLPFDRHVCHMAVGSFTQGTRDLVYTARLGTDDDEAVVSHGAPAANLWELERTSAAHVVVNYGEPASYANVELKLHLKREPMYHVSYSMIPAILFVAVSYNGFFIDRFQGPARVANALLPVLVLRVLQNAVFARLELISYRIYLAEFLMIAMFLACFCVFEYGAVHHFLAIEKAAKDRRDVLTKMAKRLQSEEDAAHGAPPRTKALAAARHHRSVVCRPSPERVNGMMIDGTAHEPHDDVEQQQQETKDDPGDSVPHDVTASSSSDVAAPQGVVLARNDDAEDAGAAKRHFRASRTASQLASQYEAMRTRHTNLAVLIRKSSQWFAGTSSHESHADDTDYEPPSCDPTRERDEAEMRRIFDKFDYDKSEAIDAYEVACLLRYYGIFVDAECARATMCHYRFCEGKLIPKNRRAVTFTFQELKKFITYYDDKYSIGVTTRTFVSKPTSLQLDIACRILFLPACFVIFFLHWIWWFPANKGKN
mmetsp:Transcript_2189/g.8452  ORF Transcript_2189/g.8452 Transcript_2189/m.8452 type:complete len:678 (-) Transcript_2189:644-2677(-)